MPSCRTTSEPLYCSFLRDSIGLYENALTELVVPRCVLDQVHLPSSWEAFINSLEYCVNTSKTSVPTLIPNLERTAEIKQQFISHSPRLAASAQEYEIAVLMVRGSDLSQLSYRNFAPLLNPQDRSLNHLIEPSDNPQQPDYIFTNAGVLTYLRRLGLECTATDLLQAGQAGLLRAFVLDDKPIQTKYLRNSMGSTKFPKKGFKAYLLSEVNDWIKKH